MTRSELIAKVAADFPGLTNHEIDVVVSTVFDEITAALARGERAELRGFGSFATRHRGARTSRNPRTGEPLAVPAKVMPTFKASRALLAAKNGEG